VPAFFYFTLKIEMFVLCEHKNGSPVKAKSPAELAQISAGGVDIGTNCPFKMH